MPADPAIHAAIDLVPRRILDAVDPAARALGMTSAEWLSQVLQTAVAAQIESGRQNTTSPSESSWLETVSAQDDLVPIAEVDESQNAAGETLGSVKDELEQIRRLVQDYMSVVEPAIRPIQSLPEHVRELSALADEVRQSADAATRAANSVRPLERTLLRLAGGVKEEPEPGHGARAAGIGRLFRR